MASGEKRIREYAVHLTGIGIEGDPISWILGSHAALVSRITELRRQNNQHSRTWRKKHPRQRKERQIKHYDGSKLNATKHRADWTIAEIELLQASKSSGRVLAQRLGRTLKAIEQMRYRLKKSKTGD